MVRISKQAERRSRMPRRPKLSRGKTGTKKDNLSAGFKEHPNALQGDFAALAFIPKIK